MCEEESCKELLSFSRTRGRAARGTGFAAATQVHQDSEHPLKGCLNTTQEGMNKVANQERQAQQKIMVGGGGGKGVCVGEQERR